MEKVDFTELYRQQPGVRNGVLFFDDTDFSDFEKYYLGVRKLEGRLLTDEEVKRLPSVSVTKANYQEWEVRRKSTERFLEYCKSRLSPNSRVLDIGCGNGWFSNQLYEVANSFILGLDVNAEELKQAQRCFGNENIHFCYLDIFSGVLQSEAFDMITINSTLQYFSDPKPLISLCLSLLSGKGELHIIDSPFYRKSDVEAAQERTKKYYQSIDHDEMSRFYFHHPESVLDGYECSWLYSPKKDQIKDAQSGKYLDCPFPWVRVQKGK